MNYIVFGFSRYFVTSFQLMNYGFLDKFKLVFNPYPPGAVLMQKGGRGQYINCFFKRLYIFSNILLIGLKLN